ERAGQDEDAAAELGLEAELAVDHRGDAVDVHRHGARPAGAERGLDRAPDADEAAWDHPGAAGRVEQREQPRRAWVDRMEAVPEAGDVPGPGVAPALQHGLGRARRVAVARLAGDLAVQLHALLARAAVDVIEDVDRRG